MTRAARRREPFTLTIDNLSHEGRGVGRRDGKTVFVTGALPGELVTAKKLRGRRSFDEAIALDVENPSPDRVEARCDAYDVCGGCSLQHLAADKQVAHKQAVMLELLRHHAECEPQEVLAPLRGAQWHYRRRARLGVKFVEKKGGALVGFREKSSPFIADISRCEVLDRSIGYRLAELRALINGLSIPARVPQLEVAVGDDIAALIVRHLQPFTPADLESLAEFQHRSRISLYLQPGGEDTVHALNEDTRELHYSVDGIEFKFQPNHFVQVNQSLNRQMIAAVVDLLALDSQARVVDLFCGLGNISLPVARHCASVTGIEGSDALVELARRNAADNGIRNAEFVVRDLASADDVAAVDFTRFDAMVLDPPRSGAEQIFLSADLSRVTKLAYVSCNPVTMARDTRHIVHNHGFELTHAGVMDMFPHTAHVESLAVFARC